MTWASAAFEWGDRVTPISTIDDELPEPTQTGLEILLGRQAGLQ